jgi:hypothetical protein
MASNHVVVQTMLAMRKIITERLQSDVPDDDVTRADVVKLGLLNESKTGKNIQIGINSGDHDKPEELDGIVTLRGLPKLGIHLPEREIGGGQTWMRRGTCAIECFFIRERLEEAEAFQRAYEVLGRLTQAIEETPINELPVDSFGERAISIHCYASSYFESGGPPKSYVFRGKAHWAIFTSKTTGIQYFI